MLKAVFGSASDGEHKNPIQDALARKGEKPAHTLAVDASTSADYYGITLKPSGKPDNTPIPTGTKGKGGSGLARPSQDELQQQTCINACQMCLDGRGTLDGAGKCTCSNGSVISAAKKNACIAGPGSNTSGSGSSSETNNPTSPGSDGSTYSGGECHPYIDADWVVHNCDNNLKTEADPTPTLRPTSTPQPIQDSQGASSRSVDASSSQQTPESDFFSELIKGMKISGGLIAGALGIGLTVGVWRVMRMGRFVRTAMHPQEALNQRFHKLLEQEFEGQAHHAQRGVLLAAAEKINRESGGIYKKQIDQLRKSLSNDSRQIARKNENEDRKLFRKWISEAKEMNDPTKLDNLLARSDLQPDIRDEAIEALNGLQYTAYKNRRELNKLLRR